MVRQVHPPNNERFQITSVPTPGGAWGVRGLEPSPNTGCQQFFAMLALFTNNAAASLAEPARDDFLLGAPLPARHCVARAERLSLHALLEPFFLLGSAPSAPLCDEDEDDWARLTRRKASTLGVQGLQAASIASLPCRDRAAIENGTISASDDDRDVLRLWGHITRHKRLPRQSAKNALVSISAVVTLSSHLVEATLRPGVVLYHSAPKRTAAKLGSWSVGACSGHWSGRVAESLLPVADLFDKEQNGRASCRLLWEQSATGKRSRYGGDGSGRCGVSVSDSWSQRKAAAGGARVDNGAEWEPPADQGMLFLLDSQCAPTGIAEIDALLEAAAAASDGGRVATGGSGVETLRVVGASLTSDLLAGAWCPPRLGAPRAAADTPGDVSGATADSALLLDLQSKEALARFGSTGGASHRWYVLDPSLSRYRATLWAESGLAAAHGSPSACLSARASALLVASLLCSKVTVHAAHACVGHGKEAEGEDCLLLKALVSAGLACLEM